MSYWDTSALAKLYLPESDSIIFQTYAARPDLQIVTARLTLLELRRAAFRKELEGAIQPGATEAVWQKADADADIGNVHVIEFDKTIISNIAQVLKTCYRHSAPVAIRTLDAIHLASALVARETEIVATDRRLRDAAILLGFSIYPR